MGVILLMSLIGGGVVAGFVLGRLNVGDAAPKDHAAIAAQIKGVNVAYNTNCKLEFVRSDNAVPLDVFQVQSATAADFTLNTKYQCSEWRFTINDDVIGYMKLYGPDENGNAYYLCIVSMSMHDLRIETPIETVTLTFSAPRYDTLLQLTQTS